MTVAHLIPGPAVGNKSTFTQLQVAALSEAGVEPVSCYLPSRTNPLVLARTAWQLIRASQHWRANLIHAHFGTVTALVGAVASVASRRPLVVTFHGSDLNRTASSDGWWRDLLQRCCSNLAALRAVRIICVSEVVKGGLWWRRARARVIPSGIDFASFRPLDIETCRRKLNWDRATKVVLFNNGNGSPIKRQDLAEQAVAIVNVTMPVRLEVLVNAAYESVPIYMNAADCLLLCSESEGSPTVVKEAMACNLPVVAVDIGDVAAQLAGCVPSEITDRQPEAIARALLRVLIAGVRSNGRELANGRLDVVSTSRQVLDVYSEVLA